MPEYPSAASQAPIVVEQITVAVSDLQKTIDGHASALESLIDQGLAELASIRLEGRQAIEQSKNNRQAFVERQADEKRRLAQLSKLIAATETAIVNTQGYAKIIETEAHHKALTKEIRDQMDANLTLQSLHEKYQGILGEEKGKAKAVQDKH